MAHSLAAPGDTATPPAAWSSPCLPPRHSSRSCAQRRRTSSCTKSKMTSPESDRNLKFTHRRGANQTKEFFFFFFFKLTCTHDINSGHPLLTCSSGVCRSQSTRCPGTCYTGKVFHRWAQELLKSEEVRRASWWNCFTPAGSSQAVLKVCGPVISEGTAALNKLLPTLEEWMWRFGSHSNPDRWLFSVPQIVHTPKLTSSNTMSEDYIISGGLNLDNDCLCLEKTLLLSRA